MQIHKVRIYPFLLLMAFLLNAIMPFYAVYNVSAHTNFSSVFGDKIPICTGAGFKWVTLADLQSGKEKPKPHSDEKCPLCYAAHHGIKGITPTPVSIASNDSARYAPRLMAYDFYLPSLRLTSSLHSRAPPASFIG